MLTLLNESAPALRRFLGEALPRVAADWWNICVVRNLTDQQARVVRQKGLNSLDRLDLAALLRVFDANYFDVSNSTDLPRETRNWLKELQQVRNRWAHHTGNEERPDDLFRDLDTLERFLGAIRGDVSLIASVKSRKATVLGGVAQPPTVLSSPVSTEFQQTQIVLLKSSPTKSGPVLRVLPGTPQNRYEVFLDGRAQTFYADQLDLTEQSPAVDAVSLSEFRARLTAQILQHPGIATLYSLHAARVDYVPYQFRPVIKFIRSDRPRLLIADEVGVGKTIEAGLILRELQARKDVKSVLVLCPKALVTDRKWERDLRRFDERFTQLDSKTLRYCINETHLDGEWPQNHAKTILSFSAFSDETLFGNARKLGLLKLDPPPRFDLVIVDEAHHLRNAETFVHKAVRFFTANADAVLFLTATPIQLGSDDLFVLLNLLRPDVIIDRETFKRMADPNPHINRAVHASRAAQCDWQTEAAEELREASGTPWGQLVLEPSPEFKVVLADIEGQTLDLAQRVSMINRIEALHTFARFINRTRRRDIGEFTSRKPETVEVDFTPEQRRLHDDLMDAQRSLLEQVHGNVNLNFMMTTIRRQAASCLHALAPCLRDVLLGRLEFIEGELDEDEASDMASADSNDLRTLVEAVLAQAERLPADDAKLDALLKIVREKEQLKNNKVLLFATFRHTLNYLHEHLQRHRIRCGLMLGATPDEERVELRRRFSLSREDSDAIDVLLSSEIGCEGLDYQFCDCLVNYDLQWNPMRIEQRIGRIDRYGQQSETIAIYNLITPGTVDADIYDRCLVRIGVFRKALGGSEEILGEITREIHSVAENLSLTTQERQTRLEQLADNQIRLLQEEEAIEEKQRELFGIRPPSVEQEADDQASANFWVNPAAMLNLVMEYLGRRCGGSEYVLGEKPLKTLRVNEQGRRLLLEDFLNLQSKGSVAGREWSEWLKGSNQHLAITVDQKTAKENLKAVLITPVHPLAQQAARALVSKDAFVTCLKVKSNELPPGTYPFAIHQWTRKGVREDVLLQPVSREPKLVELFPRLIAESVSCEAEVVLPPASHFDALEADHYALFARARAQHQERERELVAFQKASLETSHRARAANLGEMIANAGNEKILLMRTVELQNAETDFRRRVDQLDLAASQADILSQQIARGVVVITGQEDK
ncbi:MAG: SNF2-related protein [Verrucomicrobia bacterium]|nr:SNF2-related protein [Verrucomicrobiota bacterium]